MSFPPELAAARNSALWREIHEQPQVVAGLLDKEETPLRRFVAGLPPCNFALFAARGTSDHAATYATYALGGIGGLPVALATPSLHTIYHAPPLRFEAGTGNIADAVGLGAALDYVTRLGMANIARREHELLEYGTQVLTRIPGLTLVGTAREKTSVLSFVLDGHETEDVGAGLARQGIAVRAGHHCAQPILRRFGHERTVRPSLAFYNTCEELDQLGAAIHNIRSGRVERLG